MLCWPSSNETSLTPSSNQRYHLDVLMDFSICHWIDDNHCKSPVKRKPLHIHGLDDVSWFIWSPVRQYLILVFPALAVLHVLLMTCVAYLSFHCGFFPASHWLSFGICSAIFPLLSQNGNAFETLRSFTGVWWEPSGHLKCTWVTVGVLPHNRLTEQIFRVWCLWFYLSHSQAITLLSESWYTKSSIAILLRGKPRFVYRVLWEIDLVPSKLVLAMIDYASRAGAHKRVTIGLLCPF